jgi:hypothetical protein
MEYRVTGCKDCPFYVDERDLNGCYHPSVCDTYDRKTPYPRFGKDVYNEVISPKGLKKSHPDWCPLVFMSINITMPKV